MPKSNTRKLNDTQLVILSSASQREDGLAVLPEGVRAASVKAAVIRLSKLGFLKQVRVKRALELTLERLAIDAPRHAGASAPGLGVPSPAASIRDTVSALAFLPLAIA